MKPYLTTPIKRKRRSKQEMAELLTAVKNILEDGQMTIRHLF